MRRDDLAPRLEPGLWLPFERRRLVAGLVARLLLEDRTHQLVMRPGQAPRPARFAETASSSRLALSSARIGIGGIERVVVRPVVAHADQLVDQRAMRPVEHVGKHLAPIPVHCAQQGRRVEVHGPVRQPLHLAAVVELVRPGTALAGAHRAVDERVKPGAQQFERPADPIAVRYGHDPPRRYAYIVIPAKAGVRANAPV